MSQPRENDVTDVRPPGQTDRATEFMTLPQSRGLNKWWEEHPHTFWEFIIKIATSIKYVKTPWEGGEGQGGKWISKINELQATHSFKTQK